MMLISMTKFNNWYFSQNIVKNQNPSIMHISFICKNSFVVLQTEVVAYLKPPTMENPFKNLWIAYREMFRLTP